jgi:hypothetical protein
MCTENAEQSSWCERATSINVCIRVVRDIIMRLRCYVNVILESTDGTSRKATCMGYWSGTSRQFGLSSTDMLEEHLLWILASWIEWVNISIIIGYDLGRLGS